MQWFTPAPWTTPEMEVDLRPGGIFRNVMQSPDGERMTNGGSFLEVVPNERLVWTSALLPGFRPAPPRSDFPHITAAILLAPEGSGTKYTAIVMHPTEEGRQQHEAMGFHNGWSTPRSTSWWRLSRRAERWRRWRSARRSCSERSMRGY